MGPFPSPTSGFLSQMVGVDTLYGTEVQPPSPHHRPFHAQGVELVVYSPILLLKPVPPGLCGMTGRPLVYGKGFCSEHTAIPHPPPPPPRPSEGKRKKRQEKKEK